MRIKLLALAAITAVAIVACASPQEKAAKAQQEYTEEKTKTLRDYKKCIKKAGGDAAKQQQCDALLKAVSAVEGGSVGTTK